jgi:hypothetical protein
MGTAFPHPEIHAEGGYFFLTKEILSGNGPGLHVKTSEALQHNTVFLMIIFQLVFTDPFSGKTDVDRVNRDDAMAFVQSPQYGNGEIKGEQLPNLREN